MIEQTNAAPGITVPQHTLLEIIAVQQAIVEADLRLDDVMNVVVDAAARLTRTDAAVVELADGDQMVYRAGAGRASAHVGIRLTANRSLSGLCVAQNKPLLCDDTESDERVDREACRRVGARSMIVAPLRHRRGALGVLKVYSSTANAFSTSDLQTLELLVGVISAALERAREHERLQKRVSHDPLTGLLSREQLFVEIEEKAGSGRRFAVVFFDVDDFKQTNDVLGHAAGDAVLRAVGKRLHVALRHQDIAGRFGGDEFVVVIDDAPSLSGAEGIARRLAATIGQPLDGDECNVPISASAGVAIFPEDGLTPQTLLHCADERMYAAKRARRSTRNL